MYYKTLLANSTLGDKHPLIVTKKIHDQDLV